MQRELRDKNDNNTPSEAKFVRIEEDNEEAAAFQVLKTRDDENEALKARVAALEAQLSSGQDNAGGGGKKRKQQATKQNDASKDRPRCAECGKPGHVEADCWTRAERILKEKKEKFEKQNSRRQPTKEEVAAFHAGFAANKETKECWMVQTARTSSSRHHGM